MLRTIYYYDPIQNIVKEKVIETNNYKNMDKTEKIKEIVEEPYKTKESIYNGPYTKTALFLLPMLDGLNLRHPFIKKYLYNAYLDDVEYEHIYTRPIFILLKTQSYIEKDYCALINLLRGLKEFKIDYDLGTQDGMRLNMMIFETDPKYKEDYYHFKAGRYSKFSKEYKAKFPEKTMLTTNKTVESLMYGVMHKTSYRKDEVAKHFAVKNDKGEIREDKIEDYNKFRKDMDTWEEVWDRPDRKCEYFHNKD